MRNGVMCVKSRYVTVSAERSVPTPTAASVMPTSSNGTAKSCAEAPTPYHTISATSTDIDTSMSTSGAPIDDSGMMRRGKYTLLTRCEEPTSELADDPTEAAK